MSKQMISFVIPCYSSSKTIRNVVDEIELAIIPEKKYDYEIILINDSSPDDTFKEIEDICESNLKVIGINFSRNFGQHAALMAGFNHVNGDIIICLDDDGQTPANECLKLIGKLNDGYDAVYASYSDKKHSILRNLGSTVNELMTRALIGKPKDLYVSSYFAAKRFIIDQVKEYHNPYPYVIGLVLRATDKIVNVPVTHRNRLNGKSGYTFKKLLSLWFNGFTAFSIKPLRFAIIIGLIFAVFGFSIGVYAIINKLINADVLLGWSSTIASIMCIGGLILFVLGLIGEYVGRIYISINKLPQYVIRQTINAKKETIEND